MQNWNDIIGQFNINGRVRDVIPFGAGHIHDTYRVKNGQSSAPDYLLQKINNQVFPDVVSLMENMGKVTSHINSSEGGVSVPELILTKSNSFFFRHKGSEYWRVSRYVEDSHSFDLITTPEMANEGAKAFGSFLIQLSSMNPSKLKEVIPNFHNCIVRVTQFTEAVRNGVANRLRKASELVTFVNGLADQMCLLEKLRERGKIPLRITHNDTKFNNLLFSENGEVLALVDLDTVMPGIVHYDFGDGIRTGVTTMEEDEKDLKNVDIDFPRFAAYANGYLEKSRDLLSESEMQSLYKSGALLAFIMGVRFLTDFLMGDVYYKTEYEEHNFIRASCQLQLVKKFLEGESKMKEIIENG